MLHLAVKCTRNASIRSFRDAKRLFSIPASTAALTPDEVVAALDKHIVGQSEADHAAVLLEARNGREVDGWLQRHDASSSSLDDFDDTL